MEGISGSSLTSAIKKGTFVKWVLANPSHQDSKSRPATSVNWYAKQLGGKKKKEKKENKLLLYVFTAFCSHHGYNFWLENFNREGFYEQIAEIQIYKYVKFRLYLILANTNVTMVPLSSEAMQTSELSLPSVKFFMLPSLPSVTLVTLEFILFLLTPAPSDLPWLFSSISVTRCRF